MSVFPPATKGTTMVTGFIGQVLARKTHGGIARRATTVPKTHLIRRNLAAYSRSHVLDIQVPHVRALNVDPLGPEFMDRKFEEWSD